MFTLHRFPIWFAKMEKLAKSWKTRIFAQTTQGIEISPTARFKKGLPQDDALCPMLFILCLNTIAWKVRTTEVYRLSKPLSTKITHLLYIDDMKLFAASENKLKRVMTVAKNGMESTGLKWNEKKCAVIHVKRGQVEQASGDMKTADLKPVKSLDQHNTYKFLGVFENTKQEDKQVLEATVQTYLQIEAINHLVQPTVRSHKGGGVLFTSTYILDVDIEITSWAGRAYRILTRVGDVSEIERVSAVSE